MIKLRLVKKKWRKGERRGETTYIHIPPTLAEIFQDKELLYDPELNVIHIKKR